MSLSPCRIISLDHFNRSLSLYSDAYFTDSSFVLICSRVPRGGPQVKLQTVPEYAQQEVSPVTGKWQSQWKGKVLILVQEGEP